MVPTCGCVGYIFGFHKEGFAPEILPFPMFRGFLVTFLTALLCGSSPDQSFFIFHFPQQPTPHTRIFIDTKPCKGIKNVHLLLIASTRV